MKTTAGTSAVTDSAGDAKKPAAGGFFADGGPAYFLVGQVFMPNRL
jgi:hypothetical protein